MIKKSIILLILLMLVSVDSSARKPKSKVASEPEKTMVVKIGEVFVLKIKANHTTGYEWMLSKPIDSTIVQFIDKDYQSDSAPEGMTGVGGVELWKFKALKKGTIVIKLKEVRPWEANAPNPTTTKFKIVVKK